MSENYILDIDELRKVYRLETKSPLLSKLDPDFYKELKRFLIDERKKYAQEMKDSFSARNIKRLETIKQMVEKIREIRLKKCLNLCLMYSRTNDFSEDGLIDFELDFAKGIIKLIDKQNDQTQSIMGIKKADIKNVKDLLKVKFLQEIPAFIGGDLKEYGPYEKDQICELPEDVCKLLESKNIIEVID
ncbi:MAG: hypothetical protein PHR26_03760 [Candidatus ainarchaeum sp.]|nr:hypothetical protein [Candidatus ainarchaeum sp.]MDD3976222.1 hypothetical protein [Candidatus ainarchaeum sp.]